MRSTEGLLYIYHNFEILSRYDISLFSLFGDLTQDSSPKGGDLPLSERFLDDFQGHGCFGYLKKKYFEAYRCV